MRMGVGLGHAQMRLGLGQAQTCLGLAQAQILVSKIIPLLNPSQQACAPTSPKTLQPLRIIMEPRTIILLRNAVD